MPEFHSKLLAPPPVDVTDTVEYDGFGQALAMSGNLLVIGVGDDELGNGAGAAYAYVMADGSWQLEAKILPQLADGMLDGQSNAFFGTRVVLDGNRLVVSAPARESSMGAAYAYERIAGVWEPRGKLVASAPSGEEARQESARFGSTMAISGDTLVISSPQFRHEDGTEGIVHVFVNQSGNWVPQANLVAQFPDGTPAGLTDSAFGSALSVSGDTIAVGDYYVDSDFFNTGCVYTYVRSGTTWSPEARLVARTPVGALVDVENQHFGIGTHLSGDWLFVSTEEDYNDIYRAGSVRVFKRSGGTWSPNATLWPRFGDGSLDANRFGQFGVVAASGDQLAIGAIGDDERGDNYGAVYLYELDAGNWLARGKLVAQTSVGPDGSRGDTFGGEVALGGGYLIVGARGDDEVRTDSGSVYVFTMP